MNIPKNWDGGVRSLFDSCKELGPNEVFSCVVNVLSKSATQVSNRIPSYKNTLEFMIGSNSNLLLLGDFIRLVLISVDHTIDFVMTTAIGHLFSAVSFITLVLVILPFPWHFKAGNIGTCIYMAWTALGLLSSFVNSIIWRNNVINHSPVWCDITSKLIIGNSIAISAATLCIARRLHSMTSLRSIGKTQQEKYRDVLIDLTIGVGIPVLVMVLHYIVQGHRFDIVEEVGCYPSTYNTPLAYVLVYMWPILLGLVSGSYNVRSIIAIRKRRVEFLEVLSASDNNANHYIRLMALSGVDIICSIPLAITIIVLNATRDEMFAWGSWENVHVDFSGVYGYSTVVWRSYPVSEVAIEMTRWLLVACGLLFVIFFGFTPESLRNYKFGITSIVKSVSYSKNKSTKVDTKTGCTEFSKSKRKFEDISFIDDGSPSRGPIIVDQAVIRKVDSTDLLSDISSMNEGEFDTSELPSSTGSPLNALKRFSAVFNVGSDK